MNGQIVVGLDIGTTHLKAAAFGAERPITGIVATSRTVKGLFEAVTGLMRSLLAQLPSPPVAVGICSMAETGAALRTDGSPLSDLVFWNSPPDTKAVAWANKEIGAHTLFARTGLALTGKLPLIRLRSLGFPAGFHWLGAADLVAQLFTGQIATCPTLAARTGLYCPATGTYDPDLLQFAGISEANLPPVLAAGAPAGVVTPAQSAACGLPAGIPVVIAGHDHLCAAYGAGVTGNGQIADSTGTAEAIVTVTAAPVLTEAARVAGFSTGPHVDGVHACLIGGLSSAGSLIDQFLPVWQPDLDEQAGYRWLASLAAGPPTGIIVEPYLRGRAAPAPDPARRLRIHPDVPPSPQAVIEGICAHVRWMAERSLELAGNRWDSLTILGGGTRNPMWMAVKAALTPVPAEVVAEPQAAAYGAARLAAASVGFDLPPLGHTTVDPAPGDGWDSYYDRFVALAADKEN